jgi:hypothetical protein
MIQLVIAAIAMSCSAATNDLENAILSFPDIPAWQFRPDEAVRCANIVIAMGQTAACAELGKIAREKGTRPFSMKEVSVGNPRDFAERESGDFDLNRNICFLCRLVFMPSNSTEVLRPPGLGAASLVSRELKEADWPCLPFSIVNDVPLSITGGYTLQGWPEASEQYLSYCMSNGVFRTQPFPVSSIITASNALAQVLASPAWKRLKWNAPEPGVTWVHPMSDSDAEDIKAYAAESLWKQIENIADSLQAAGSRR